VDRVQEGRRERGTGERGGEIEAMEEDGWGTGASQN